MNLIKITERKINIDAAYNSVPFCSAQTETI